MKTCLSSDHPIGSLLYAGVFIAVGTQNFYFLYAGLFGVDVLFRLLWLLLGLASYGLALSVLRNGLPSRSEWAPKLLEPDR